MWGFPNDLIATMSEACYEADVLKAKVLLSEMLLEMLWESFECSK